MFKVVSDFYYNTDLINIDYKNPFNKIALLDGSKNESTPYYGPIILDFDNSPYIDVYSTHKNVICR